MEQHCSVDCTGNDDFPIIPKKRTTSRGIPKFSRKFSFHSTLLPEFLKFSVEWFAFRKFNSFRNFWKLFQEISVPFAAVSKFSKVLVEWKAPNIHESSRILIGERNHCIIRLLHLRRTTYEGLVVVALLSLPFFAKLSNHTTNYNVASLRFLKQGKFFFHAIKPQLMFVFCLFHFVFHKYAGWNTMNKCPVSNGPFAASGHMVQNPPCWRASCPLGHPEQKGLHQDKFAFPLFWMSQCVACSPAWWILYHVTASCKGPIALSSLAKLTVDKKTTTKRKQANKHVNWGKWF